MQISYAQFAYSTLNLRRILSRQLSLGIVWTRLESGQ